MCSSISNSIILPILYGIEKNGKIKQWSASIFKNDDNTSYSIIEFGQVNGVKQTSRREYVEGKNINKKNETTPFEQCVFETKKKWQDKIDKYNYVEKEPISCKVVNNKKTIYPMLANKYDINKRKKNDIIYPCFVQPKLDGLRCIMYWDSKDEKVVSQSRTGCIYETMTHIENKIKVLFNDNPNLIIDGELYTNEIAFEELAGLIKKKKITEKDREKLLLVKYHIYDIINDDPYIERYKSIEYIFEKYNNETYIKVNTRICENEEKFKLYFYEYIENGYEGIILRNKNGIYRQNYRSNDLQKYKEFQEDEYSIVGYKEAEGRDKGTVIWICKNDEGREFSVRPRGSQELRRGWLVEGNKFIGKKLTIIYQELSEHNIPRFPVGKCIRDGY